MRRHKILANAPKLRVIWALGGERTMSDWWEWVPFAKTIVHWGSNPYGRAPGDYAFCQPTPSACAAASPVAVLNCQKCLDQNLLNNISDWAGIPLGSDFLEEVAGQSARAIGAALAKRAGGSFLGLSAAAWTGVGTVLAIDAGLDAAAIILRIVEMLQAASTAKKIYCVCPSAAAPAPPGSSPAPAPPPPGGG
jgi:hypothetical protein